MISFRKQKEQGYFVTVKETWQVKSRKEFNQVMQGLVNWGFSFYVKPINESIEEFRIVIDCEVNTTEDIDVQKDILEDMLKLKEDYGDLH